MYRSEQSLFINTVTLEKSFCYCADATCEGRSWIYSIMTFNTTVFLQGKLLNLDESKYSHIGLVQ